jgi:hypothetical protein
VAGATVTAEPGIPEHIVAWLQRVVDVYATHDADLIVETVFTEDGVYDDHRPIVGAAATGHEQLRAYLRTTFELAPDFAIGIHVLDARDDVYLARDTYEGHSVEGGGSALLQWWVVDRMRGGRLEREDVYETEAEARAAFEAAAA